jgi:hypothetical protein
VRIPEISVYRQCWAHSRRGFVEAEKVEPMLVTEVAARIRAQYVEEEEIAADKLRGEAKLERRVERCKPIVEAFFAWCNERLQDQLFSGLFELPRCGRRSGIE